MNGKNKGLDISLDDFVPSPQKTISAPPITPVSREAIAKEVVPVPKRATPAKKSNVPFQVQVAREAVRAVKYVSMEEDGSHGEIFEKALREWLKSSVYATAEGDNPVKRFVSMEL